MSEFFVPRRHPAYRLPIKADAPFACGAFTAPAPAACKIIVHDR
jgi:hypothetical protein